MPRLSGTTAWLLILVTMGTAAAAFCMLTAPVISATASRDFFDSPYLLPAFLVLTVLSGLAGWFAPTWGFRWGLVATVPFYVLLVVNIIREETGGGGQGLWPVGLLFLVFLTILPVGAALATSRLASRLG